MTKEAYFEKLSYALRRRELLPRPVEEDGLLPVEWNGCILCRVTERGAVRYDPTWVDTDKAKAALAQVREAAGTVLEYMTLLEAAPPLKAEGLTDGYRVLAEFNGTVLAGTETLLGAQFVTWARDYDWRGVNNGHYYMEDYQGAKEDFALRSGLVARERVFDREQLEELRQAVQGFLRGEGPASYQQEYQCRRLLEQINEQLPARSKIKCRGKVIILNSLCEGRRQKRASPIFLCSGHCSTIVPTSCTPRSTRRSLRPGRCVPAPPSARAAPTPPTASSAGGGMGSACARRCGSSMPQTGREGIGGNSRMNPYHSPLPPCGRPPGRRPACSIQTTRRTGRWAQWAMSGWTSVPTAGGFTTPGGPTTGTGSTRRSSRRPCSSSWTLCGRMGR